MSANSNGLDDGSESPRDADFGKQGWRSAPADEWDESPLDLPNIHPTRYGNRSQRDHLAGKRRRRSRDEKGGWGSYPKS
jgi:hypothetical protein